MSKISKRIKVSAGVVIVRKEKNEYLFLMMRSGGYWEAGAKGKVEKGESEFEGALREVEEETTLTPDELDFKWGKIKYTTEPYTKNKKKIAVFYLAEVERAEVSIPFNPEIGKKEHDEYQWMTYNQAKKVVNDRISKVLDWANEKIHSK